VPTAVRAGAPLPDPEPAKRSDGVAHDSPVASLWDEYDSEMKNLAGGPRGIVAAGRARRPLLLFIVVMNATNKVAVMAAHPCVKRAAY